MALFIDNTNVVPPDFGQSEPIYPRVEEMVRVSGSAVASNVYPAFIQQWTSGQTFRDRTACYLTEPNGALLGVRIYDARLVGAYAGLPLYATGCCT